MVSPTSLLVPPLPRFSQRDLPKTSSGPLRLPQGPKGQGRKSPRLCWTGLLRIRRLDPIAEASELPDHSRSAPLLRLFGNGWASFFVTDSLVQDQPDQPPVSMGNGPDGLLVPETRYRAVVDKLEDASFSPGCGVGRLVENTPHVAVPLRGSVAIVHARALAVAGTGANPGGELLLRRKGRGGSTDFGNDLLR